MSARSICVTSVRCLLLLAVTLAWRPLSAQGGPPPQMRRVIDATVAVLAATDRASVSAFADVHLSPSYRDSMTQAGLFEHMESLRAVLQGLSGDLQVEGEPDGVALRLGGEAGVTLRLKVGAETQWQITELSLVGRQEPSAHIPSTREQPATTPREAAIMRHAKAIERVGQLSAEASLAMFEAEHFADGLVSGPARAALLVDLAGLHQVIAGTGVIKLQERGEQTVLQFRGGKAGDVAFTVATSAPFQITAFTVDLEPPLAPLEPIQPLAWEDLDTRLRSAESQGFSGMVIAQRGGITTLSRGYGFADSASRRVANADSVFDIGSMPIDFTRAAVLWLQQEGKLQMTDRLERFFPSAPNDKRAIELGQLMSGRSGLANFHHRDGDADKDLSLVDRETALRRIFEQPLLFAPGDGHSHSHSAFGLLAMVVEKVSGQSYGEFLHEHLFGPAGMSRTGFYGEMLGLQESDFAIGYGQPASTPNIPPLWGPVSWLVIGSGGMVSSVADMQRGYNYIVDGKWLRGAALREYQSLQVGIGGSDRGYFFLLVAGEHGDALFLASNSEQGPADNEPLLRSMIAMVLPERATKTDH